MFINLRDFYPYYTCDAFVEVSDEIGAVLLESKREEKNYIDRLGYHKAYYSLDRGDGIENDAVDKPMTPEDAYIHKAVMAGHGRAVRRLCLPAGQAGQAPLCPFLYGHE